jgi:hypothetical protein
MYIDICQLQLSTTLLATNGTLKWLFIDDKSNPYIDVNQFSRKLVAT